MSKKLRSEMLAAVGTSRLQEKKKNYHRAIKKSRNYPFLCRSSFTIANDKGPTLPVLPKDFPGSLTTLETTLFPNPRQIKMVGPTNPDRLSHLILILVAPCSFFL